MVGADFSHVVAVAVVRVVAIVLLDYSLTIVVPSHYCYSCYYHYYQCDQIVGFVRVPVSK